MANYKKTSLWKSSFDQNEDSCNKLKNALDNFRERAIILANEISRDQPKFTVHDISHIDALWGMGSLIVGDDFQMTPTEGFVLGGAFLVHDIAMSLSAYSKGINELKGLPQWNDTIFALLKSEKGYDYSEINDNDVDSDIEEEAKRILLRDLHAKKAKELCLQKWLVNGNEYYLIDNPELRESFGNAIGDIATSHWWSTEEVKSRLNTKLGAPVKFPSSWTIDFLKLACIIRLADYCHIDETRAPSFLMSLRKPEGIAKEHWVFQNKLLQPFIEYRSLVYTSKNPFKKEESASWWRCYDTLKSIDHEIRRTNNIIQETQRNFVFQIEGIRYIESPTKLAEKIQTDKWLPIDATIKVTNVAHLAKTLGGKRLYGDDKTVPFRELIQNAADAIRARRLFEGKAQNWGEIIIREGNVNSNLWVEIEDNGIGMSEEVIKGPFLDFGTSFWGSEIMLRDFPGLLSKGFSATGRYGIGFFSVFMICDKVEVTTLRTGQAKHDTLVLEFGDGLDIRPVLRKAENDEYLNNGGTKIRLWLKPGTVNENGKYELDRNMPPVKLHKLIEWLCPSIDVNINFDNNKKTTSIIKANDWLTMSGEKFLKRISNAYYYYEKKELEEQLRFELKSLRLIIENGKTVGRGCFLSRVIDSRKSPEEGIITIGGFRANRLNAYGEYSFFGILLGKPRTAVRNYGIPFVKKEGLAKWATDQGKVWEPNLKLKRYFHERPGSIICSFGGNPGNQSIGLYSKGELSIELINSWYSFPNEIIMVDSDNYFRFRNDLCSLADNVFFIIKSRNSKIYIGTSEYGASWSDWPAFSKIKLSTKVEIYENSTYYWILKVISEKWNTTISQIIDASDFSEKEYIIGATDMESVKLKAHLIKNPNISIDSTSKKS